MKLRSGIKNQRQGKRGRTSFKRTSGIMFAPVPAATKTHLYIVVSHLLFEAEPRRLKRFSDSLATGSHAATYSRWIQLARIITTQNGIAARAAKCFRFFKALTISEGSLAFGI